MTAGKYEDALGLFHKAAEDLPLDFEPAFLIAKTFFKKGDRAQAKNHLLKALQLSPDEEETRMILELTNWRMLASFFYYSADPAFSADGKLTFFTSAREDTNGDGKINMLDRMGVWCVNVETGAEEELAPNRFHHADPAASPDGKFLCYLSWRKDTMGDGVIDKHDAAGVYLLDLEAKKETCLVPEEMACKHPRFSPDGRWIIFCCFDPKTGKSGVRRVELSSGVREELVEARFDNTFPSLSFDNNLLVYASWREDTNGDGRIDIRDHSNIFIKNLSENREESLLPYGHDNSFPSFSADGRSVLYLSRRRDTNKDGRIDSLDNCGIYAMDILSRKERMLVPDDYYNKYPLLSSDGKELVHLGNWHRGYRAEEAEMRDRFEYKGIYAVEMNSAKSRQIVSDKNYGATSPALSSRGDIAYIGWTKGTRRGLYLASLRKIPTLAELKERVEKNL